MQKKYIKFRTPKRQRQLPRTRQAWLSHTAQSHRLLFLSRGSNESPVRNSCCFLKHTGGSKLLMIRARLRLSSRTPHKHTYLHIFTAGFFLQRVNNVFWPRNAMKRTVSAPMILGQGRTVLLRQICVLVLVRTWAKLLALFTRVWIVFQYNYIYS